ncbi:MAG: DUF2752 domain-containing protein [Deltaproteobacteria bacterium]|nr:DUF2752 domain-containing protein [Deltaproteobacteria bacterium]
MLRNRWILGVGVPFAFVAVIPFAWIEKLPLCMFHQLTGWDCPGCGLTRAMVAMFHGQWLRALEFNALAPVVALYLVIYAGDGIYTQWRGSRPNWATPQGSKIITWLFGVLAFGQWGYKSGLHFINLYFN